MERDVLIGKLQDVHSDLIDQISELDEAELIFHPPGKWSAIQHLAHIHMSVRMLQRALMLPPFVIQAKYGLSNREGRSYEGLVNRYKERLAEGGKAGSPFSPQDISPTKLKSISNKLRRQVHLLSYRYMKLSEDKLDTYILPHPLLGKLTLREMAYFTIYHAQHHSELIARGMAKEVNS
jgi:hypothetical protein